MNDNECCVLELKSTLSVISDGKRGGQGLNVHGPGRVMGLATSVH